MKIIFSRKGIDSSFGNYASPILPNGQLCWLPIPEDNENKPGLPTYGDILFMNTNLGSIIEDLTSKRITKDRTVHLDPDLLEIHRRRKANWMPVFGQTGAAESHLKNKGVSIGDVFLFFGWFKQCEIINGKLKYKKNAPDLHVLYGWLQVAEVTRINHYYSEPNLFNSDVVNIPEWLKEHPHIIGKHYGKLDTLYFSTDRLKIKGNLTNIPGAGVFEYLSEKLILTADGQTRSIWNLPEWMFPSNNKLPLSYNEKLERWAKKDGLTQLKSASRGQEFVLDTSFYPEASEWLLSLIKTGTTRKY